MFLDWLLYYSIPLIIISLTLYIFRYQILYTQPDTFNDEKVLPGRYNLICYLDTLLCNPSTHKQRISHDLINNIYVTSLNDQLLYIKKLKRVPMFLRFLYQLFNKGPIWLLNYNREEYRVLRLNSLDEDLKWIENSLLCFRNGIKLDLGWSNDSKLWENGLLEVILTHLLELKSESVKLNNEEREDIFKRNFGDMCDFLRGIGYLLHRQLLKMETKDFLKQLKEKSKLFNTIKEIGHTLDSEIFRIRLRIANLHYNISGPEQTPDLVIIQFRSHAFHKAKRGAQNRWDKYKEEWTEKKNKWVEKWWKWEKEAEFMRSYEGVMQSLSEVEKPLATSPEAFTKDKKIAKTLVDGLKEIGKLEIKIALFDAIVIVSNQFLKMTSKKHLGKAYDDLSRWVVSRKLGIEVEALDANPGFKEFVEKIHLHRYLLVFGHIIHVDQNYKIHMLFEGESYLWEDLKPLLKYDPTTQNFTGHYTQSGLVNEGVYEWTEFKPFFIETKSPPPWGNRYLFEICSWIIDKPRISGDHTFLRLKTPKGEIYSVGQYVPSKLGYDRYMFPMALKPSRFMSPDVSEFWNGKFTTLAFEISEVQFRQMKHKIEEDKKNQLHLYQVYTDNCTIWAKSIAEIAGLDVPSSLAVYDLLFPTLTHHLRQLHRKKYIPKFLKPFVKHAFALFVNSIGLLLGAGMIHKQVKKDPNFASVKPYIYHFWDLFDPSKGVSQHPFIIGHYVRIQVELWRKAKLELLNEKLAIVRERIKNWDDGQLGDEEKKNSSAIPELELGQSMIPLSPPKPFMELTNSPRFSPKTDPPYTTSPILHYTTSPTPFTLPNPHIHSSPSSSSSPIIDTLDSPYSSPHLTPSIQHCTLNELLKQEKNLLRAIERVNYDLPPKFKKAPKLAKRSLSTDLLMDIKSKSTEKVSNDINVKPTLIRSLSGVEVWN